MAAIFLRSCTPNSGVLICGQGEFEALNTGWAPSADFLGGGNLFDGLACCADRKEELRAGVAACGIAAPSEFRVGDVLAIGNTLGDELKFLEGNFRGTVSRTNDCHVSSLNREWSMCMSEMDFGRLRADSGIGEAADRTESMGKH